MPSSRAAAGRRPPVPPSGSARPDRALPRGAARRVLPGGGRLPDRPRRLGTMFQAFWMFGMVNGDGCVRAPRSHSNLGLLSRKSFTHEVFESIEVQVPHLSRWLKHELALFRDSEFTCQDAKAQPQLTGPLRDDRKGV